jgi:hypothetical protein
VTEAILNREDWLGKAAILLAELLEGIDNAEVPPMRISVGFPGGRSNRNITVGQCWPTTAAEDGVAQIFISPIRGEDETVHVLATLLHEMIHAIDDCSSGHRGNFLRIAKAVGFTPKYTSSDNRTEELNEQLQEIGDRLGLFPHPALITKGRAADEPKKQTTRMLKLTCVEGSGYTVRTTRKWLDEVGPPACGCHDLQMELA